MIWDLEINFGEEANSQIRNPSRVRVGLGLIGLKKGGCLQNKTKLMAATFPSKPRIQGRERG